MRVIVFVSRITDQKMADVVAAAFPEVIGDAALCVLLGDGERHLEEQFAAAAVRYPGRIAFRVGYEEPLAHRLVAGGDILFHTARLSRADDQVSRISAAHSNLPIRA
jgi:starch synthase